MYNAIQNMNRFVATWSGLRGMYVKLVKNLAFLRASDAILDNDLDEIWGSLVPGESWVLPEWEWIQECLGNLQHPTTIDLLRFR